MTKKVKKMHIRQAFARAREILGEYESHEWDAFGAVSALHCGRDQVTPFTFDEFTRLVFELFLNYGQDIAMYKQIVPTLGRNAGFRERFVVMVRVLDIYGDGETETTAAFDACIKLAAKIERSMT